MRYGRLRWPPSPSTYPASHARSSWYRAGWSASSSENAEVSYPGSRIRGMTSNPIGLYEAAAAQADRVVAAVREEQLDDPTPCSDWRGGAGLNQLVARQPL